MTILQLAATAALIPVVTFCSWRKGRPGGYAWGPIGWAAIALLVFLGGTSAAAISLHSQGSIVGLSGALGGTRGWFAISLEVASVWALWRLQPPKLWGESLTPRNRREVWATVAHHAVAGLLLIPLWSSWPFLVPALVVFIALSTWIAVLRAQLRYRRGQDVGQSAEFLQGLGFALVLAGALLVR